MHQLLLETICVQFVKSELSIYKIKDTVEVNLLPMWTGESDKAKVVYDEVNATCITVLRRL